MSAPTSAQRAPARFPCIVALEFTPQDNGATVLFNPHRDEYFKLGALEARVIRQLTGEYSREVLRARFSAELSAAQVDRLLDWAGENGLLVGSETAAAPLALRTRLLRVLSGEAKFRLTFGSPDRFLRTLDLRRALSRPALIAYFFLALAPLLLVAVHPPLFGAAATAMAAPLGAGGVVAALVLVLLSTGLHELGHAAACVRFGGRVRKIGLMFLYFIPAFYCDVSASWSFRHQHEKIVVAAAGMLVHLLVAALFFLAWTLTRSAPWLYAACTCWTMVLVNLFPFVKLDGYWIAVHLLDEPNLRAKAIERVLAVVRRPWLLATEWGNVIFYFGLASLAGALLFGAVGLLSIHTYLALLSRPLANVVVLVLAGTLLARVVRAMRPHFTKRSSSWTIP